MNHPIELRQFLRRFTLDDARAGVQPLRQEMPDRRIELFNPPSLQYRYRMKDGGWSAWLDAAYVREEASEDEKIRSFES